METCEIPYTEEIPLKYNGTVNRHYSSDKPTRKIQFSEKYILVTDASRYAPRDPPFLFDYSGNLVCTLNYKKEWLITPLPARYFLFGETILIKWSDMDFWGFGTHISYTSLNIHSQIEISHRSPPCDHIYAGWRCNMFWLPFRFCIGKSGAFYHHYIIEVRKGEIDEHFHHVRRISDGKSIDGDLVCIIPDYSNRSTESADHRELGIIDDFVIVLNLNSTKPMGFNILTKEHVKLNGGSSRSIYHSMTYAHHTLYFLGQYTSIGDNFIEIVDHIQFQVVKTLSIKENHLEICGFGPYIVTFGNNDVITDILMDMRTFEDRLKESEIGRDTNVMIACKSPNLTDTSWVRRSEDFYAHFGSCGNFWMSEFVNVSENSVTLRLFRWYGPARTFPPQLHNVHFSWLHDQTERF